MTKTFFPPGPDGIRTKTLASLVKISIRTLPQDTPGEGREGGAGGGQEQTPKGPGPDILEAKGSEAPHLED